MPTYSQSTVFFTEAPTPWGAFVGSFSCEGLFALDFPGNEPGLLTEPNHLPDKVHRYWEATCAALADCLVGHPIRQMPPLDLRDGTEFQRRVWSQLKKLRPGSTLSYQELAHAVGAPKAARAVGAACGANPIPVLIPCHRVLTSTGALGGFSGGLEWKRRLLQIEGITFLNSTTPSKDPELVLDLA